MLLYLPALFICAKDLALLRLSDCQGQLLLACAIQPQHEQRVRWGVADQVEQCDQARCLQKSYCKVILQVENLHTAAHR